MTRPLLLPRLQQLFLQLLLVLGIALRFSGYWLRLVTRWVGSTLINKMLEKLLGFIGRYLNQGEAERIEGKFKELDTRLDAIEKTQLEQNVMLLANREITLSETETLHQSINSLKSSQEAWISAMNLRFSYTKDVLDDIKGIVSRG